MILLIFNISSDAPDSSILITLHRFKTSINGGFKLKNEEVHRMG
jgi:hypothetical protein